MTVKRLIILTLLIGTALSVAADSMAELTSPIESLSYHIRLKASGNKNLQFRVFWNRSDSDSTFVDLDITPPTHDDFYPSECRYRVTSSGSVISEGKTEIAYKGKGAPAFSAILNVDRTGAQLGLGTNEVTFALEVPFDKIHTGAIGYRCPAKNKALTNQLITRNAAVRQHAPFADIDSLMTYLAASEDIREGVWTYLDRDIDRKKADIGSFYTLATVADGHGGYDIIYLGGEDRYSYPHEVLEIKGGLSPTPFIDNFDLTWICGDGRILHHDTSAAFEAGNTILRLSFPLLNSSVRFMKRQYLEARP